MEFHSRVGSEAIDSPAGSLTARRDRDPQQVFEGFKSDDIEDVLEDSLELSSRRRDSQKKKAAYKRVPAKRSPLDFRWYHSVPWALDTDTAKPVTRGCMSNEKSNMQSVRQEEPSGIVVMSSSEGEQGQKDLDRRLGKSCSSQ